MVFHSRMSEMSPPAETMRVQDLNRLRFIISIGNVIGDSDHRLPLAPPIIYNDMIR
jgi:hypothetical protein